MMINYRIKILILSLFITINSFGFGFFDKIIDNKSDSMPFGIISIPLPNLDELGEEGELFFDEFSSDVYSLYNNGIIQISNKHKVPIKIKDIAYRYNNKEVLLIPNSENEDQLNAVEDFYSKYKINGKKLLKKLAIENQVVAIAFGHIANSQVKKAIKNGLLKFAIKIYLVQSEATMYKTVTIKVDQLATDPYYDPDELVINVEKNVLAAYEQVIATIQQSGDVMSSFGTKSDEEVEQKESNNDQEEAKEESTKENMKLENIKEEEGGDDDW